MRIMTFLCALSVVAVLVLAQTSSVGPPSPVPQVLTPLSTSQSGSDGVQMWRRAEIRVMPLDLVAADRAELASLRERIARAEADSGRLDVSDPAVREQFLRQFRLMEALLSYAERRDSDEGKSPSALGVQRHLNQIEGQRMCAACHSGAGGIVGAGQ
jgi:hypothetical protein